MTASVAFGRDWRPGLIGRITALHARYYHAHAGFGLPFEAKVARELAEFCARYDPVRDGLWHAEVDGEIEAAIAIDGAHPANGAHLRWFIASDRARGRGLGAALLETAIRHCREQAYPGIYLWTFEGLQAARHLYDRAGFRLVHAARGSQWGKEVVEQRLELLFDANPALETRTSSESNRAGAWRGATTDGSRDADQ